jgi:hypothetical protein
MQSQMLAIVVAGGFFVFSTATRDVYIRSLSADRATAEQAAAYLSWFVPALALQFGLVAMSAALRGTGNFKPGSTGDWDLRFGLRFGLCLPTATVDFTVPSHRTARGAGACRRGG